MGLLSDALGLVVPETRPMLALANWAHNSARWFLAHPMTGIALLAAMFGAVEHHEADRWAHIAATRNATIAAMQAATVNATRQAQAEKEARDVQTRKLAADSDRTAGALGARYHAAVLRLAAAEDHAGGADLPLAAAPTQGSDRAGKSAELPAVAVSSGDALICGENTARLQAVHNWATGLSSMDTATLSH